MKLAKNKNKKSKKPFAVVFDWDDVVFDTAKFKKTIAKQFIKDNIPVSVTLETFSIAKDAHGYNPAIHGRMIAKRSQGNAVAISRAIWMACHSLADRLLFRDAIRLIEQIHSKNIPLHVLSAGRKQFQKIRIYNSGLVHFFKSVHIVDVTGVDVAGATKVRVLERLCKQYNQIIFLDDRPKTIDFIKKNPSLKGKVLAVLVSRNKHEKTLMSPVLNRLNWKELEKIAIHNGFRPY